MSVLSIARWRKTAQDKRAELDSDDEEVRYKPISWPLVRRLMKALRPHARQYALGLSLAIVKLVLDMCSPLYLAYLVNYVTAYGDGKLPGMSLRAAEAHVGLVILYWGATMLTSLVLFRFNILIMTGAGERVQFGLRRALFAHLQELSMSFYDRTRLGRIISRCTSDIGALREVNVWGSQVVTMSLLQMAMAVVMLWWTDARLFLAVVWLGPVLFVLNEIFRRKVALRWQIVREHFTRVSTNLAENITGMRVVTAFNRQGPNRAAFNSLQDSNTENNLRAARINGLYQPMLELIRFLGRMIMLALGGYLVVRQHMLAGGVVAALLYWNAFMDPIINLGNFSNQLMMAMASAERIFALLDTKPEVQDLPDARALPRIVGSVTFEHVTFAYRPQRPVLHDICFQATPGQMVALVGHTGGGKSSIISLIARFYQPQEGRVRVDGVDIRHVTGDSLHRQMGLVLQANYLFSGTVTENIRYGCEEATEQRVIEAARAIGSYDVIASLQNGFDTEVGERGASMSLGQRQIICFTRAFLADPRIFLLDEATSAVDTATELVVQRSLEKLLAGRTTFIVAHRLSTIMRADNILVIDGGRLVEQGTHRQLLAAGGHYAGLYEQFVKSD